MKKFYVLTMAAKRIIVVYNNNSKIIIVKGNSFLTNIFLQIVNKEI